MRQSDACVAAVREYCKEKGIQFEGDMREKLSQDDKAAIVAVVTEGLLNGEIDMSERARAVHETDALMRSYAVGLLNNHLRKHKALNGGVDYEPKQPGKFAGSKDPKLKALKQLLKAKPELADEIQPHIDRRMAEIAAEKASKVEIDVDQIPEELREKLGL